MKREDRDLMEMDHKQAMREFIDLAKGSSTSKAERVLFTEELMHSMVGEALAVVMHHYRNGSLKAAMYIIDRGLGVPDKPFSEAVANMTKEEVEAEMVALFRSAQLTDDVAHGLTYALRDASVKPVTDKS